MLVGALAAAALIALTLIALFGGFGGSDSGSEAASARETGSAAAGAAEPPQRVTLVVTLRGSGKGEIQIAPGGSTCDRSCERRYDTDTRVTVTATAASGSTFEGWGDACSGTGSCSITLDEERSLSATFDSEPREPARPAPPPAVPDEDLDIPGDDLEEELDPVGPGDCSDGRDNDGDGLTDTAQDPDCAEGNTEAGGAAAPAPPPPPPPARATDDCSDGRDNDGDGLTDTAQDPDCLAGKTESGRPRSTAPAQP